MGVFNRATGACRDCGIRGLRVGVPGFPAPTATKKMHVLMHVQKLDSTGRAGAP